MTADIVTDAPAMAWSRRKPEPCVMFHSVCGSQYAAQAMRDKPAGYGMTVSMSRKANCRGHARSESFLNGAKNQRVHGTKYETRADGERDLFDYIAAVSNRRRRHTTPGRCSPVQFLRNWD